MTTIMTFECSGKTIELTDQELKEFILATKAETEIVYLPQQNVPFTPLMPWEPTVIYESDTTEGAIL